MMLKLAQASTLAEINNVERLKKELRTKTLNKVAKLLNIENIDYEQVKDLICVNGERTRSTPYDEPTTTVISLMPETGPVIQTEWAQNAPYNLLLPTCYMNHFKMNYPAGCGIIAGAQTLAAIAPSMTIDSTTIDWSLLTAKSKIEYNSYFGGDYEEAMMVSKVVKDMYTGTGSTPVIDSSYVYAYGEDNTIPAVTRSQTSTSSLLSYLKKYVSCGTYYSQYAPDPLLTTLNINQSMPCVAIMGGTCEVSYTSGTSSTSETSSHAWIIDCYAQCTKSARAILKSYDLYFHANMGWEGTDDGYYKVNADTTTDFETQIGNFNTNFWEITEIHKK